WEDSGFMRVYGRLAKPTHITNQIGERLDVIIVPRPVFLMPMRRRIRIGMYDRRVEYPPRGTAHGHTRPGARGQRRRVLRAHLPGRSPNKTHRDAAVQRGPHGVLCHAWMWWVTEDRRL